MKSKLFNLLFIITLITMGVSCYSIANPAEITSFPWYVGIVFPACFISFPMFFYSLLLKKKNKTKIEFYISLTIILLQIYLLFA